MSVWALSLRHQTAPPLSKKQKMSTSQFEQLLDELKKLNSKINKIDKRVSSIESDISVIKDDISIMKDDISALKECVSWENAKEFPKGGNNTVKVSMAAKSR